MTPAAAERIRIISVMRIITGGAFLGIELDAAEAIRSGVSADDLLRTLWGDLSTLIADPKPVDTLKALISSITGKPTL